MQNTHANYSTQPNYSSEGRILSSPVRRKLFAFFSLLEDAVFGAFIGLALIKTFELFTPVPYSLYGVSLTLIAMAIGCAISLSVRKFIRS